jgi:hypothetical protein
VRKESEGEFSAKGNRKQCLSLPSGWVAGVRRHSLIIGSHVYTSDSQLVTEEPRFFFADKKKESECNRSLRRWRINNESDIARVGETMRSRQ